MHTVTSFMCVDNSATRQQKKEKARTAHKLTDGRTTHPERLALSETVMLVAPNAIARICLLSGGNMSACRCQKQQ